MTEQIEIQTTGGTPVMKLQFDQGEDRWSHRLFLATEESDVGIMASDEGTPDQYWPSSAPLQDVSRHCLDQGDAILCVGMAGNSHWSASYSVECRGQTGAIKADLACLKKSNTADANIGSTYALDSNCQVQSLTDRRVEILLDNQYVLEIEALSGDELETVFELNDRTLTVKPSRISTSPVVATRWGFLLTCH